MTGVPAVKIVEVESKKEPVLQVLENVAVDPLLNHVTVKHVHPVRNISWYRDAKGHTKTIKT